MDESQLEYSLQMLLEDPEACQEKSRLRMDLPYFGFDNNCGKTWIYPTNYPKREYQYSISRKALYHNTLVVLPTGLGKTFIAAVVMYNFYRWYPKSKIIFMAPARPLVAQQIDACYNVMGIPKSDTVEITGRKSKKDRQEFWKSKRVFFATPQAVISDMLSPEHNFPVNDIRLVVIDEAHKAKGKYAYTEVINYIQERNQNFRVLALSATPGRDLKDVREIAQNLLISNIEVRYETSIDVAPYTFQKHIKTEVVPLDSRIKRIREGLVKIIEPYVEILKKENLLTGNAGHHSKGWIIMQQNEFRRLCTIESPVNSSDISAAFSICVSLYHSLEVLERHGCRMFLNSFIDEQNRTGFKYFVNKDLQLKQLLEDLKEELCIQKLTLDRSLSTSMAENPLLDFGHPKFEVLEYKLLNHFKQDPASKVIVFCELRETVLLIDMLLSKHKPLIRPRKMVGQGSSSGIKAVTQKEQLAVMKEFKEGGSNCLIATCVVEEGIDVGDVMMIVCFDSNTNPTRFVQRIGRTGRKQKGNVLMLVAEGKEQENLKKVLNQKDKTTQKLANRKEIEWFLYKHSPRLVPPEFEPTCMEVCFDIQVSDGEEPTTSKGKSKKKEIVKEVKPAKKGKKVVSKPQPGSDMRKFFKPINLDTMEDDPPLPPETEMSINNESFRNRSLPRPKPPPPPPPVPVFNSTMIDFTPDERNVSVIEDLNESDDEWEMLQQIRKSKRKISSTNILTDKAVLDNVTIDDDFKKYLLEKENRPPNVPPTEIQTYLSRILKENELTSGSDNKRIEILLECVKNYEKQLNDEKIPEMEVTSDEIDFEPEMSTQPEIASQFNFIMNSQPSRYLNQTSVNSFHDSPLFKAFDRGLAQKPSKSTPKILVQDVKKVEDSPLIKSFLKIPAESTPKILALKTQKLEDSPSYSPLVTSFTKEPAQSTPSTSRVKPKMTPRNIIKPFNVSKKVEEEQEVLNSLGLKSLDDLFGDFDDFDGFTPDEKVQDISSKSILKDVTNKSINKTPKTNFSITKKPEMKPLVPSPITNITKKRVCDEISSPSVACSNNSKRPKLEFVDLNNIFGDSDDDLFGDSDVNHSSIIKTTQKPVQKDDSPTTELEKSISQLNNSLSVFLAEELAELDPVIIPETEDLNKTIIINTESSPEKELMLPSTSVCKTPERPSTSIISLNDTSPSIFPIRSASQAANRSKISLFSAPTATTSQAIRPVFVRNKRQRKILSESEDSEPEIQSEPIRKVPKRANPNNNKSRRRCAFLDTEAGVSGNESDDLDISGDSDLQDFVVDEPSIMNDTNMFAKYVQSTRSPHRFQKPRELRPFIPEEIYSQAVPVEASQYDLNDSFVAEDEDFHENTQQQEMTELEIAEAILEAERKEKRRKRRIL